MTDCTGNKVAPRNLSSASLAAFLAVFLMLLALIVIVTVTGCGSSSGGNGGGDEVSGTPMDTGLPQIKLLKPAASGGGEVPNFAWEAVQDATRYRLVVTDAAGKFLWAWNGADTAVNLGGLPGDRPADISGPVITPGCNWSVIAFNAAGKAMSASDIRPVSP